MRNIKARRIDRTCVLVTAFRTSVTTSHVTCRLRFTLRANICRTLDGDYYNFAAVSFHTKKLCSRLYSIEIEFYTKTKKTKQKIAF